jgi:hypothetical protein
MCAWFERDGKPEFFCSVVKISQGEYRAVCDKASEPAGARCDV